MVNCPFRKKVYYENRIFGQGHPAPVMSTEEFMPCIKEECAACEVQEHSVIFDEKVKECTTKTCNLLHVIVETDKE